MESLSFTVPGVAASKGSVTRMKNGAYLPAGTAASRMNYNNWKDNIATAARQAMHGQKPWAGAIRLMAEFSLPVPKSMPMKERGWIPHTKRPDYDKLVRALLDPMTGIVWVDDSQVCYSTINKLYAWNNKPGVMVVIDFLDEEWHQSYAGVHKNIINVIDSL